jgi:hypothetical protein
LTKVVFQAYLDWKSKKAKEEFAIADAAAKAKARAGAFIPETTCAAALLAAVCALNF